MSYAAGELSSLVIIMLAVAMLLSVGTPVIYLIWYRRKTHASFAGVGVGALIFISFVVVEKLIQAGVLYKGHAVGSFIQSHPLLLSLVAALFAGVFEEVGRYVGFHLLKKKHPEKESAVMYGIGHGGIEALIFGGLMGFSNLASAIVLNTIGMDGLTKGMDAATAQTVIDTYSVFFTTSPFVFLVSGFERIFAFTAHMGLTMFVYRSVRTNKIVYLLIAIALHAGLDFLPGLYATGMISNIWAIEGFVLICAIVFAWLGYQQYKKAGNSTQDNVSLS